MADRRYVYEAKCREAIGHLEDVKRIVDEEARRCEQQRFPEQETGDREKSIEELKTKLRKLENEQSRYERQCREMEMRMKEQSARMAERFGFQFQNDKSRKHIVKGYNQLWTAVRGFSETVETVFNESQRSTPQRLQQYFLVFLCDMICKKVRRMEEEFKAAEEKLQKVLCQTFQTSKAQALGETANRSLLSGIIRHMSHDRAPASMVSKEILTKCVEHPSFHAYLKREAGSRRRHHLEQVLSYAPIETDFRELDKKMSEFAWEWLCFPDHGLLDVPEPGTCQFLSSSWLPYNEKINPLWWRGCAIEWVVWPLLRSRSGEVLSQGYVFEAKRIQ